MTDKIRAWWSEDKKWFCVLANDGVSQSTVSLTPDEAREFFNAYDRGELVPANESRSESNQRAIINAEAAMREGNETTKVYDGEGPVPFALAAESKTSPSVSGRDQPSPTSPSPTTAAVDREAILSAVNKIRLGNRDGWGYGRDECADFILALLNGGRHEG